MQRLEVQLLGEFRVQVDSSEVADEAWPHGRARQLVKLLALQPRHALDRDRVIEALWPHLDPEAGAANLHKAASYARRTLGDRRAIVLRSGRVELAPDAEVSTDVERYEAGDEDAYGGELLPDDRYEDWTTEVRERIRAHRTALSRQQGRWEEVLAEDPTNEVACRAVMRELVDAGNRAGAVRRFKAMQEELARIGLTPERETQELFAELSRGPAVQVDPVAAGPLAGRDRELAAIDRALRSAEGGSGGLLLVWGDAGIGKTRLAEAALREAGERGWHTLRGSARPEQGLIPYGPVLEALASLRDQRPDLASHLGDNSRRALQAVSPRPQEGGAPGRADSISRQEVIASVTELVEVAARECGIAIVLDDLHAADDATLKLLGYLARSAGSLRALIVVCARPTAESSPITRWQRELADQRLGVPLPLEPVDEAASRTIAERAAGRELPPEALAEVERSGAGNPFFIEELGATVGPGEQVTVPHHVQELLRVRLEQLQPPAAELLPLFAVLEQPFSSAEVAALAGGAEGEARTGLEVAVAGGVLRTVDRDRFQFRHPLLYEAARDAIPADELAAAHLVAARRLEQQEAPPERIAHHLLAAGRGEEAVPFLSRAAAWALGVGAYGEGLEWTRLALDHAPDSDAPDSARPALLELLADLLDRTGDPNAPLAYADALTVAEPEAAFGLRIKQARAYLMAGDVESASRAIEALNGEPPNPLVRLRAILTRGFVAWHRGEIAEARSRAAQARELSEKTGITELVGEQEDLAAIVAHAEGNWGRHIHWRLDEAWRFPEVAGRVYDAYLCVTEYVMQAGEPYDKLRQFAAELRANARRAGARRGEAYAITILGEAELLGGDPEAAREHLTEAARLSREVRATGSEAIARARLGEAMLHLGDRTGAGAQLEEALGLAYHSSLASHLMPVVHGLAISVPDDPGEAMEFVDRAESILDDASLCRFCRVAYYVSAAGACARAGELDRARVAIERAEEATQTWQGWTPWNAAIAEARAELLVAEHRSADAAAMLRRAQEGFAAAGQRLGEARVRESLAALGTT